MFLTLTDPQGEPLYVNVDHILYFQPQGNGSDIFLAHSKIHVLTVRETPDEVLKLLQQATPATAA